MGCMDGVCPFLPMPSDPCFAPTFRHLHLGTDSATSHLMTAGGSMVRFSLRPRSVVQFSASCTRQLSLAAEATNAAAGP